MPSFVVPTHRRTINVPHHVRRALIRYTHEHHDDSRTKAFKTLGISPDTYDHIVEPNGRANERAIRKVCALLGISFESSSDAVE